MQWTPILIFLAIVAAFVLLKQLGSVSRQAARDYLRQGAKIIDVRSPAEFRDQHLPKAINIPLGELEERIGRVAPNKDEILLLHCLSGGRSGIGRRVLKGMGYTRVFNLGSFGRASRILADAGK